MLTFTYCIDGEDAMRLRASEFERHAKHIGGVEASMRLGFPLSTEDCDTVAGDDRIVSSVVCYETDDVTTGMAYGRDDPYFQSGAWSRLEFYSAPTFSPPQVLPKGTGRHYLALLRRSDAPGFGVARLTAIAEQLQQRRVLEALLECEGFSCHARSDFSALSAIMIFREADFQGARVALANALLAAGEKPVWTLLSIPRVAGSWLGVSPSSVISEHLTRGR